MKEHELEHLKTIGNYAREFGFDEIFQITTKRYKELLEEMDNEKAPWDIN